MLKGYTNRTEIENYLLIDIDESFHDQVNRWITDIEKYIDNKTDRNFVADEENSDRYFDGNGANSIFIDDVASIDKIYLGDGGLHSKSTTWTELTDDQYFLYPSNEIKLLGQLFNTGYQNIKISGKWGAPGGVPGDIMLAATVLVAGIINYAWADEGEVKSMSIGRYSVTYKDEKQWQDFAKIEEILEFNRKISL